VKTLPITILAAIIPIGLFYILIQNGALSFSVSNLTNNAKNSTTPSPVPNYAVNLDAHSSLTYWQKGIVNSVKVTTDVQGVIIEVDTDGQIEEHGWAPFDYALKLRIKGENGDENDIFISEEELQKTTFRDQNDHAVNYKSLKLNDEIRALIAFDLTKEFGKNFISAEFIKL
jgi:hypothetical protein